MKTQDQIEKLHDQASKISANDLILEMAKALLIKDSLNPKAILILKTYLLRALEREGIK